MTLLQLKYAYENCVLIKSKKLNILILKINNILSCTFVIITFATKDTMIR